MIKSIKTKMILVISLLILLLIAGSFWFAYNQARNILRETIINAAADTARLNAEIISELLNGFKNEIANQVDLTVLDGLKDALVDADSAQIIDIYWLKEKNKLVEVAEKNNHLETLFIADLNGRTYITDDITNQYNISDREYFQKVIELGRAVISHSLVNKATGEKVIVIATPIIFNEKVVGVLGGTFHLGIFQERVNSMKINGNGYGWLIDGKMFTVAHPDDKYLGNKEFFKVDNQGLEEIASRMVRGETGTDFFKLNGVEKGIAFAPIKLTGWSLAMVFESSKVMAPLKSIQKGSLWIGLIAVLLGLIINYFIATYIAKPIIKASKVVEKLAAGDFREHNDSLNITRRDEVGSLIQSINKMRKQLGKMIKQVADLSKQVAVTSKELSASGDQVGETAEQVGGAIQDVAAGAEKQSVQLSETAENIKSLIKQIEETGEISVNMSKKANEVMDHITTGNVMVANSVDQITEVKTDTTEVATTISSLGDASNKIGEIVELINGIAAQTNLLALNAAIEAARAGEAGRGFSVVADEIRELAEESTRATEKIDGLIKEIQNGVAAAVNKMDEGIETVDDSVKAIEETGKIFARIKEAAGELMQLIEKVAGNSKDMADKSGQVENALNDVTAISQEAASNAEEVAASSEEQSAATEEIITSASQLAKMAGELADAVARFNF